MVLFSSNRFVKRVYQSIFVLHRLPMTFNSLSKPVCFFGLASCSLNSAVADAIIQSAAAVIRLPLLSVEICRPSARVLPCQRRLSLSRWFT